MWFEENSSSWSFFFPFTLRQQHSTTQRSMATHLYVRAETKPLEKRVAISPANAKKLIDAGYVLSVERFPERAFRDEEYESVGCTLVDNGSWPTAPESAFIVGLKELPEEDTPLKHRHIYFAHCYKGQTDWDKVLGRFQAGKGLLLDLGIVIYDHLFNSNV